MSGSSGRGKLPPVHPGEVLLEEFMKPVGLSRFWLGLQIDFDLDMAAAGIRSLGRHEGLDEKA